MDNFKINVDREKLSSDYIQSKQNFKEVMHHLKATKPPVWKSGWFYGTIGLASIAGVLIINTITSNRSGNINADNAVQQQTKTQTILAESTSASIAVNNAPLQKSQVKKDVVASIVDQKKQSQSVSKRNEKTVQSSEIEQIEEPELVNNTVIIEEKITPLVKNTLPKISGYFNGEIPCSVLCNSNGIEVNEDVKITSFTIQFEGKGKDQTVDVEGNKIPASVCSQITERQFDQMIFITNIFGVDSDGVQHNFTPMNLIAVSQE